MEATTARPTKRERRGGGAGARPGAGTRGGRGGAGRGVGGEPRRGCGRACMAGVRAVSPKCDIVVFLDGDGSDCPQLVAQIVGPIVAGNCDFVIGSRTRGEREVGSMNFQQIFSGKIAGWLMSILYGVHYTDMCPFRAIGRASLEKLSMREETY